ncbi:MAG: GH3 auxin-responsive promoter family protein [Bacteroidia bacterium]
MPLLGALIKQGLRLSSRVKIRLQSPAVYQRRELKKLLSKAEHTAFGKHFNFSAILHSSDIIETFRTQVPVYSYNTIFNEWWHRCLKEENDVAGSDISGILPFRAERESACHIPVTREMVKALRKASIRQIVTLGKYDLPASTFEKGF